MLNAIGEKMIYVQKVSNIGAKSIHMSVKPEAREGATCFFYGKHAKYGKCLILHGGVGSKVFGDIVVLQFDNYKWHMLKSAKETRGVEACLYYHTACQYKSNLLLFGGSMSPVGGPLMQSISNKVTGLNLQTFKMVNLAVRGEEPAARKLHVAVVFKNQMLIHGGVGVDDGLLTDWWALAFMTKYDMKWIP
jgi:hypothetical protein